MSILVPTAPVAIAPVVPAGTRLLHVLIERDRIVLQRDHRRRQLPRRTGRIRTLKRLVVERLPWVGAQRVVILGRHTADETIRVEARRTIQRQHLARFRHHRYDATLQRIRKDLRDEAL